MARGNRKYRRWPGKGFRPVSTRTILRGHLHLRLLPALRRRRMARPRDFATILSQAEIPSLRSSTSTRNPHDLLQVADDLRRAILAATDKSEFTNTQPP